MSIGMNITAKDLFMLAVEFGMLLMVLLQS